MNGLNGKPTEYPENALVPYPIILAASKGDPDAMKIVLQHFSGYIATFPWRKLYDERGNVYFGGDEEMRKAAETQLQRDPNSSHLGLNIKCAEPFPWFWRPGNFPGCVFPSAERRTYWAGGSQRRRKIHVYEYYYPEN